MLLALTLHYIIHWPTKGGYNFVSGPLADITLITAFASTLWLWTKRHRCHVDHCWRMAWHPHPDHGHPVCRKHHPHGHALPAASSERGVSPVSDPAAQRRAASSGS